MTNIALLNRDHIILPHGREKYAAQWIDSFVRWLEKIIGQRISVIADGKEHYAGGGTHYALDLSGKHPHGYVRGDFYWGAPQIWHPSYRNTEHQLDAGQLIAGNGGPFAERPLSLHDEIFLTGFQLESARDVVPASVESIRPTRLARLRTHGTEVAEIEIGIRSPHGTATALLPIYRWWFLTEAGNSARLEQSHGKHLRFVTETGGWLIWHHGAWRHDPDAAHARRMAMSLGDLIYAEGANISSEFRERVAGWAAKSQSARVIENSIKLLTASEYIRVSAGALDSDPWLAGFDQARQVIDLRSGTRAWGLARTGRRIEELLRSLVPARVIRTKEGETTFFWPEFSQPEQWQEFRVADDSDDSKRQFGEICLEELANLAIFIISQHGTTSVGELSRSICRLQRIARTTADAESRIARALTTSRGIGHLELAEGYVRPLKYAKAIAAS